MNWEKETILITGASRGLGKEIARELIHRGAKVALVARGEEELNTTTSEIGALGGVARGFSADVSDIHAIYPLVARVAEFLGMPTVLINGASTLGDLPLASLAETECEDLGRVLETNLVGPFRLTKAVLGSMLLDEKGLVVNISSDAAVQAFANWGAYSVSKTALDHLGRIWAEETRNSGVRFLSVDPGEMDTVMHDQALPGSDRSLLARPSDVARKLIHLIESGRFHSGDRVVL